MSSLSRARAPRTAKGSLARQNGRAGETAAPRLVCAWQDRTCHLTLGLGERKLLAGPLDLDLAIDGKSLSAAGDWEQVCKLEEKQTTYTELSQELAGGWTLERQLLVAHEDRFCLVADCVLGPAAARIDYRLRWPLAAKTGFRPEPASHEGRLLLDRRRSLVVLPLSFPEWRADAERCSLALSPGEDPLEESLEIAQTRTAQRLHAALFIDLDPARSRRPATWRRLTIGEQLETVPRDLAAGYRVQIGKEQWLFYRSLGPIGNRTVLGVNLCTDFLAARFSPKGDVTTLIEVE